MRRRASLWQRPFAPVPLDRRLLRVGRGEAELAAGLANRTVEIRR